MPTNRSAASNVSYEKLGVHWHEMPWEVWRRNCNCLIIYWTGRGMFALPRTMPWKEWFDSGLCVCVAVHEALYTCGLEPSELLDDFENQGDCYAESRPPRLACSWEGHLDPR